MGGRGASSDTSKAGNAYGTQYHSVLTFGNIEFVEKDSRTSEPLMETMTQGRVYARVESGELKSVVYFDTTNRRAKQIDIDHPHRPWFAGSHVHHGYFHNENDSAKGASKLTTQERQMVDRVSKIWDNYKSK